MVDKTVQDSGSGALERSTPLNSITQWEWAEDGGFKPLVVGHVTLPASLCHYKLHMCFFARRFTVVFLEFIGCVLLTSSFLGYFVLTFLCGYFVSIFSFISFVITLNKHFVTWEDPRKWGPKTQNLRVPRQ